MYYVDVTFQLWIPQVLRDAGLTVIEVPGWQTRTTTNDSGDPSFFEPQGLIVHETRGSATSTDAGEINVMINGREGLSGPIAHVYLSRTGYWHMVTAGKSNHVKTGWGGPFRGLGNSRLLGIEAQHATGEPWTPLQYLSYIRGVAAILEHTGWTVAGHFEHQPGDKTDPAFNMETFRAQVKDVIEMALTPREQQIIANAYQVLYETVHEHDPINWVTDLDTGQFTSFANLPLQRAKRTEEQLAALQAKLDELTPGGLGEDRLREIIREEIGKTKLT